MNTDRVGATRVPKEGEMGPAAGGGSVGGRWGHLVPALGLKLLLEQVLELSDECKVGVVG